MQGKYVAPKAKPTTTNFNGAQDIFNIPPILNATSAEIKLIVKKAIRLINTP